MTTDNWGLGMDDDWQQDMQSMKSYLKDYNTKLKKNPKLVVPKQKDKTSPAAIARMNKLQREADEKFEAKKKRMHTDSLPGRWIFDVPANWADRIGGTRGTPQQVSIEGENYKDAYRKLIKRGIPAAVANGFKSTSSKATPTQRRGGDGDDADDMVPTPTKGNLLFLENTTEKGGINAVTAGGVLGTTPSEFEQRFGTGAVGWGSEDAFLNTIAKEGGTSADDILQAPAIGEDSQALINTLESMGTTKAQDFTNTLASLGVGTLDSETGKLKGGGLNFDPNQLKDFKGPTDASGNPILLDPETRGKTQDFKNTPASYDDEIEKVTGIKGMTADLSNSQASMIAALLSGDLSTVEISGILDDQEFFNLMDDGSAFYEKFGPQINPFLKLALDQAVKNDAQQKGIELESLRGDFLLDQAEVEALGGLTKFQAGKIRGDAAVSGATGFGAMLAADSAARRDDIKNLAAMQASGGFDDVEDMKEALRLQASGGLSTEDNILSTRQAQAATNPWAAMRMGGLLNEEDPYKTQQNINTALRGGLSATQQKDLAAAPAYAAGNPYDMTAQQNIDLQNQLARGGLQEAQKLNPFELALEGQRQRGGLGIEQYMESLRGGLSPDERLAEIRNTGYYNATRPAELQAAASGPYGYMQQQLGMGLNEQARANVLREVGQMQRGGLSVQDRLAEIQAQGAPQQLSSYLNFIGNPAAVAAAQQGGFTPFGDFAQRSADAPAGTVPQEFAGLGEIGLGVQASPGFTTPPEFTGLSGTSDYAGGLEQDATMADWDKLSGNQGQAALGEYAMQGIAPDEVERKIKSATPMSSNEYGRSPRGQYAQGRGY